MDRSDLHEDKELVTATPDPQDVRRVRTRLKTGITVDKYELIQEIASGGMSVVFKAQDLALNRPVALKFLLSDELDGIEFSTRFRQEARALATLEHSNIVKVHESNVTTDGVPYIVMNYLRGDNLADSLASEGTLSLGRWLAIMIQACAALEHAHAKGIIHRDIKPSNFVLAQENHDELLKLIDFGIAKDTTDETALTKTGTVFGSPLYMSPEQCAGAKLDERSDIYSLGCVMYEALAGKPPLTGDNSLSTMQRHINDAPDPLTNVLSNLTVNDTHIKSINSIVMKCLEKKPEDRYQKISEVKEDLSFLLQGEKPLLRLSLSSRKRQIVIGVLVGCFCGIVALMIFQFSQAHHTLNNQREAITDKAKPAPSTSQPETKAISQSSESEIDRTLRVYAFPEGDAQRKFRRLLNRSREASKQSDWKFAKELATQALAISVQQGNPPEMAGSAYWHIAHAEDHLKDYPAAKRDYLRSVQAVSGSPESECQNWEYQSLMGLGKMAAINRDFERALAYSEKAYESNQKRRPDSRHPNIDEIQKKHKAMSMSQIGEIYFMQSDHDKARTYWNAALKIMPGNTDLLRQYKQLQDHTDKLRQHKKLPPA